MWRRFVVVLACACGDSRALPDAAVDAYCPGHSTFHGVVRAFSPPQPFADWPPLAGVIVCDVDRPELPCATTGDDGTYELGCVPEGEAVVSFEHGSYVRAVWLALATGARLERDATLLTVGQNAEFYAPVSAQFPKAGYGVVAVNEVTHQDGIAFSAAGAMGPYYSADGITIETGATGTVGDGLAFFIAPVGTLTIEITPVVAEQICGHAAGAFVSTGHGLTVRVFEDTETGVYVACR